MPAAAAAATSRVRLVAVDASALQPSRQDLLAYLARAPFSSGGVVKLLGADCVVLRSLASKEERAPHDYAWAREEALAAGESGVDVVVLDELGTEALEQDGLDAALRALLWRIEEGWDGLLLAVFDPAVLESASATYRLAMHGTAALVVAGSLDSMQSTVDAWWTQRAASNAKLPLTPPRPQAPDTAAFGGPVYLLARFPLLLGLLCIVGLEVLLYSALAQLVLALEFATRANARARHDMEAAPHLDAWKRSARKLDALERRPAQRATLPPTSLAGAFERKLAGALVAFDASVPCGREEAELVRAVREVTAPDAFKQCFAEALYATSAVRALRPRSNS